MSDPDDDAPREAICMECGTRFMGGAPLLKPREPPPPGEPEPGLCSLHCIIRHLLKEKPKA